MHDREGTGKDGGFYHNTLREPITANKLLPIPTTLCMLGLKIFELFRAFLRARIRFLKTRNCG